MSTSTQPKARRRTYPQFATEYAADEPRTEVVTRREAANRLGVTYSQLASKFIDSGLLSTTGPNSRIATDEVDALTERPYLRARQGELSVLRTSGKSTVPHSSKVSRRFDDLTGDVYYGISVDDTDEGLEERSLKWLRTSAERICDNRLLVATTGEYPIAVWEIDDILDRTNEEFSRQFHDKPARGEITYYRFGGKLLARLVRREEARERADFTILHEDPRLDYVAICNSDLVKPNSALYRAVKKIMTSRIRVEGAAPVGYLSAPESD